MTPLPKKKHAKSRTKIRQAALKYKMPHLVKCSNCSQLKFTHQVCTKCGYYKGVKQQIKIKESKK
ncbi:50S ribosomal protein L32 [Candidatus Curtissbacteria bacterium RIFCSPHIGHO2_12_FULL_38_9b]|uniref:Large ribosomal subunit protein bL32 n=2 Tax=Candidatus Curtissiibacteriota TaxID=1752717 RepID=A0A1F5GY58_9BACT|nr:MAG: 50S ribosomal protein L32 [Candidatus Curtissbacteria bacterium RIFCSPLOWO2_01_FULL_37_9]OGD96749.1 MAG: 50S ribosomal protein L32 [Candidatus Curtissbacteria bacterium RIFCSPHIGHO2_12_FULL_38_9b]